MLRTARLLPHQGLLTLGSDPARFQTKPPACYRASWQLPGPDFHRQATTSLRTIRPAATSRPYLLFCWAHGITSLLSPAEDGWLHIEPQDSGGVPIVRIARLPAPHAAKQFEHLALERVVQRMGPLTHVPLSALTSSEGADYDPWWKRFGEAVNAEAEQSGLIKRGLHPCTSCGLPLLLALTAGIAVAGPVGLSSTAGVGAGFAALVLGLIAIGAASRPRLSEQGKAAAAWWRQRGSGLAGAVLADQLPPGTQPSPHSTEAIVAQGAAPLPEGHVWSSYGGQWRTIKVGPLASRAGDDPAGASSWPSSTRFSPSRCSAYQAACPATRPGSW